MEPISSNDSPADTTARTAHAPRSRASPTEARSYMTRAPMKSWAPDHHAARFISCWRAKNEKTWVVTGLLGKSWPKSMSPRRTASPATIQTHQGIRDAANARAGLVPTVAAPPSSVTTGRGGSGRPVSTDGQHSTRSSREV